MEWWGFQTQQSDNPNNSRRRNGLHKSSGGGRARGDYEGHVAESSLYTKGSMHPLLTGGLLLAGMGLVYAATRRQSFNGTKINNETPRRRKTQARTQPIPAA